MAFIEHFVANTFERSLSLPSVGDEVRPTGYKVRWHGAYIVIMATRPCMVPSCKEPQHDEAFVRIGVFPDGSVSLWVRAHDGDWMVMGEELTIHECLGEIARSPWILGWT